MSQRADIAVADDDVGRAFEERLHQRGDVRPGVLVVGVGVHDVVGAVTERRVEAGHERRGEAFVGAKPNHVVHAVRSRHLGGAVGGSVVDDE